jgi:hypothetical protein
MFPSPADIPYIWVCHNVLDFYESARVMEIDFFKSSIIPKVNLIWHPQRPVLEDERSFVTNLCNGFCHLYKHGETDRSIFSRWELEAGTECLVLSDRVGGMTTKFYPVQEIGGERRVLGSLYLETVGPESGEDRFSINQKLNPSVDEFKARHKLSCSWNRFVGGRLQEFPTCIAIWQTYIPERIDTAGMDQFIKSCRGIHIQKKPFDNSGLALVHEPVEDRMLLLEDLTPRNIRRDNNTRVIWSIDMIPLALSANDFRRVPAFQEEAIRLKENLRLRGEDQALPAEIEAVLKDPGRTAASRIGIEGGRERFDYGSVVRDRGGL